MEAGGGLRSFYTSFDSFLLRTFTYTTARVSCFLYFYDKINQDPRRQARPDFYAYAGIAGGLLAGVITNPVEIVFARQQADALYPVQARRNYKNFFEGLFKVAQEGALMRGAFMNGCKLAAICSSMTCIFDWCKENSYYFIGPHFLNRLWATIAAVSVGTIASMPFDMLRTRLYTMRPLPNGQMPYNNWVDCAVKIIRYESNMFKNANMQSFYGGMQAYWLRLFGICYISQYLLDYYHSHNFDVEPWSTASYNTHPGMEFNIHEPFDDAFYLKILEHMDFGESQLPSPNYNFIY